MLEDIKEANFGQHGVILVHIPTGCHVRVDSSESKQTNRDVALRLLQSKLVNWQKISGKLF